MSSRENQPEEIYNVPGLKALSYRIARHDDSLKRMLACLHTQTTPPDQKDGDRPLAKLSTSHRNDPAIAILDGWATVMEVLTFYQERIANEGFVNTATERLSVLELSRTVGYELDPGVAASTHLAFTIEESEDVPEIVTVPSGVRVESVPIADEDPQVFETVETLEMRGAWNLLLPYFPLVTIPQEIGEETVELKLAGTETQLAEGDALLVVEEQVEPYESRYLTLLAIEPNDEEDYTLVSWSSGLGWEPRSELQLFALREQGTLFGSDAGEWNELSPEEKRLYGHDTGGVLSYIDNQEWQSISTGLLKNADVRALVREPNTSSLFVGTHNGIFCSRDEGKNWLEMNVGLTNLNIYSLAVNEKGYIFAGATKGNVFRSIDLGESWVEIGSGGVSVVIQYKVPREQQSDGSAVAQNTEPPEWVVEKTEYQENSLPSSIIRCLAVYDNIIYAGTEYGIWGSQDSGRTWKDLNKGDNEPPNLSENSTESNGTDSPDLNGIIVYAIAIIELKTNVETEEQKEDVSTDDGIDNKIFVGTDRGVFSSNVDGNGWIDGNGWSDDNDGTIADIVYSLVVGNIGSNERLLAGTNAGVFLRNGNNNWVQKNTGEMTNRTTVYSISVASNESSEYYIYAGTSQGVFRSQLSADVGEWTQINNGLINQDIRSILGYFDEAQVEKLLAGSWFDSLYTTDWPGFEIADPQIDLNSTYANILAGSWLVLTHDDRSQGYKVKRVATVLRNDFGQNGKITRIHLETGEGLRDFGGEKYRETEVRLESEALELFEEVIQEEPPVEGDEIELDKVVPGLELERKIIISGKQMRVRIPPMGSVVRQSLLSDKTWATLKELWTYTDVNDLSIHKDSYREKLFAGTAQGVLTLELGSDIWLDKTSIDAQSRSIQVLECYLEGGSRYILAGTAGGVFRYDGSSWKSLNTTGLTNTDVRALTSYVQGEVRIILAGTAGGGVFRYDGTNWSELNDGLTSPDVRDLTNYLENGSLIILAGTAGGVFRYDGNSWSELTGLTNTDVRALESYDEGGTRYILAGTAGGVFQHNGSSWSELNTGLTNTDVRAIKSYDEGGTRYILAGTAGGVFQYNSNSWSALNDGLTNTDVRAIKSYDEGGTRYILAGTAGGVFRHDGSWSKLTTDLPETVGALESYELNGTLYILAGTAEGLFRRELDGISWDLDPGLDDTNVRALEIYAQKGDRYLLAGTENGIFRLNLDEAGATWEDINYDLADRNVGALATYAESGVRTIFVGTTAGDIFSLKSDRESWVQFDNRVPTANNEPQEIRALATYELGRSRYLLAGIVEGVFRLRLGENAWEYFNTDLPNPNVWALNIYYDSGDISLLAGINGGGIFGRDLTDVTASWRQFSDSGSDETVKALKTYDYNNTRYILRAIATGSIGRRDLGGNSWQKLASEGLTNTNVRCLKIYQDYLLAGTAGGIFRQELNSQTWHRFDNGLTNTNVHALEMYSQNGEYILAGTAEDVCRRNLNENTWEKLARGWINREVRALKIYEHNNKHYILAGTAEGVFYLDLTENSDELWISLNNDSDDRRLLNKDVRVLDIYQDDKDSKYYILAGTKSGVFSGLLEEDDDGKDTAVWTKLNKGLTNTDVYSLTVYTKASKTTLFAGTRGGNVYRWEMFREDSAWVQMRQGLANDVRAIALSGRAQVFIGTRNRSILKGTQSVDVQEMEPEDSLSIWQRRELTSDDKLKAMSSQSMVAPGSLVRWDLIDKLGFKGEITTSLEELKLEAAAEADKIVSEVASLHEINHGQLRTTITYTKPLTNTYDRATVTINGNVAVATHGETVSEEVLGSGDGSQINQAFVLKNPPLTYIPADTARGSQSTLTVRVDGLLWEEVSSLYQLTSPTHSYMTWINDDGQTRIIFGDGYKGARPTTGQENITATYRCGIGPDGEVAANTITLVQTAPLGVVAVTNSQPATGAAPPETRDQARKNAPLNTLSLDRIISLRDYEYFIGSFSGIGKAKATALAIREGYSMVQVTIAGRDGDPVASDSNLYHQIIEAVDAARDPTLRVGGGSASEFSLDSYQRRLFNIVVKLWIDPQYLASAVIPEVEKALQNTFAFEARAFAQDVTAAEIVTLIQSVNGVDGVDLDALYLEGSDRQLNQILEASEALWNGLEVEPAELLLLNPAAGSITLEKVST